jgi:putative nucleotidyltransferase with HDIG domain/PAS domain S-box-containing protein
MKNYYSRRRAPLLKIENYNSQILKKYAQGSQCFIDSLNYPVFIIDLNHNIIAANKAMQSVFGKSISDLIKMNCHEVMRFCGNPVNGCTAVDTLRGGKSSQSEVYMTKLDRHYIVNASPVHDDNNFIGVIHSFIDIYEQKLLERNNSDLIEVYASSINDMKSREMRARKGRDAFLNMMEDINESYKELEDLFLRLVIVMVNALDAKSAWTKGHSERVSMLAEQIAAEMLVDPDEIKNIKLAGLLHDIGKIGTYDYLLDKPGKLTREEFDIVKKHPSQGAEILKDIKQLEDIIPYILYHHEKLDGKGYPHQLKGADIPLGARIMHVADSYDSMTSDRPYRAAPGIEFAISEFEKYRGSQFDGDVVDAILRLLNQPDGAGSKKSSEQP